MAPRLLPLLLAAVLSALATPHSTSTTPPSTHTAHHPTHPQLLDHIAVAKTLKDDVADISLKLKDAAVKVHSPLGGGGADGATGAGKKLPLSIHTLPNLGFIVGGYVYAEMIYIYI